MLLIMTVIVYVSIRFIKKVALQHNIVLWLITRLVIEDLKCKAKDLTQVLEAKARDLKTVLKDPRGQGLALEDKVQIYEFGGYVI